MKQKLYQYKFISLNEASRNIKSNSHEPFAGLPFFLNDMIEARKDLFWRQRAKSEAGTAGLNGRNDFAKVVANEAKANVLSKLLHN